MDLSNIDLLDLPNEILIIILKKLNNIDVLYSLLNIPNERLNILVQDKMFTSIIDFFTSDDFNADDKYKIDRFCIEILPIISHNIRSIILKSSSMERILLATNFPHLTDLKIFNFDQNVAFKYFTHESPLRCIFQQQIKYLSLGISDTNDMLESSKNYTKDIYGHIIYYFKNLKSLTIVETFNPSYPRLSFRQLSPTTFFSSTLTHLCINIYTLEDCLRLFDGRLKQLCTVIVEISHSDKSSVIIQNMDDLPSMKHFSLKCYLPINQYDQKILSLLRRMSNLEKLTLYLLIHDRDQLIDDAHLENEIIAYMPRLHSFNFYIATYYGVDSITSLSGLNNQLAIKNIRQQQIAKIINATSYSTGVCHIFSLPFLFDRIEDIGNLFPDVIFNNVTYLLVHDIIPFNHQFFIRISKSFPLLKHFRIVNYKSQLSSNTNSRLSDNIQSYEKIKYPYLTKLNLTSVSIDYVEQFLNETKAYVPCLIELSICYNNLRIVTKDFTREQTRRNCATIRELNMFGTFVHTKDFYSYFPLL